MNDLVARAGAHLLTVSLDFGRLAQARWPDSGAGVMEIGSGAAIYMGPGMFVNRAVGLGLAGPVSVREIERVEAFFAGREVKTEVLVCSEADPALAESLSKRGYELSSSRDLFAIPIERSSGWGSEPDSPSPDELRIVRVDETLFPTWRDMHGAGLASDPARRQVVEDFCEIAFRLPGAEDYLAFLGDTPVAAGSLIARAGIATLGGMTTLPEFRNRGLQAAMIRYRLDRVRDLGCDFATMEADPGSGSGRNARRAGFRPVALYEFFTRQAVNVEP